MRERVSLPDDFVEKGDRVAFGLEHAEGPTQQGGLQGEDSDVDELPGLDLGGDARRAQYQPKVEIGVAVVGDNLRGILQHFAISMRGGAGSVNLRLEVAVGGRDAAPRRPAESFGHRSAMALPDQCTL